MKTRNVKTAELNGVALDWAVAEALGRSPEIRGGTPCCESGVLVGKWPIPGFSTDWNQGGPLIESKGVWLSDDAHDESQGPWIASVQGGFMSYGQLPLIAACRAIVAAKLGEAVDVPEVLL